MKNEKNLLDYIPYVPEKLHWTQKEQIVMVDVKNKGIFNRIAQLCFGRPKVSHIFLDEFGSFVWQQIDNQRSIYEIAQLVKEQFGEAAEPLYERIATYFRTLQNHGFVKLRYDNETEEV